METVGEAMLHHPTVHPADLTLGEAREVFAASTKTHLLLLVDDGVLVAAVTRDDVASAPAGPPEAPAAELGALEGRTVRADVPVGQLRASMAGSGMRRIAVVDEGRHLLGLLCLKASLQGFCTDEGVAAMRAAREHPEASAAT